MLQVHLRGQDRRHQLQGRQAVNASRRSLPRPDLSTCGKISASRRRWGMRARSRSFRHRLGGYSSVTSGASSRHEGDLRATSCRAGNLLCAAQANSRSTQTRVIQARIRRATALGIARRTSGRDRAARRATERYSGMSDDVPDIAEDIRRRRAAPQLAEPLKRIGETSVTVKLHRDVTTTLKVKVCIC